MEVATNELKNGMKIEIDRVPYSVVQCDFVRPGKGQAFCRARIKNMHTSKVIERTFKSTEKLTLADVVESNLRLLYVDHNEAVFMDDNSYEQMAISLEVVGDQKGWLKDDLIYNVVIYNGEVIELAPPTFLELQVTESAPGVRGDTASGRVLKPATLETGAVVQVPIFINEGEIIKVDTRSGEYVSRVTK